jgi:hypothetical protein
MRLGRDAATEAAYQAAKRDYRSVEDSVRITVFNWDRQRGVDGRWIAVRPIRGWRRRALVPNAFPYSSLAAGEEHWVLWSEEPMSAAAVEAYLVREARAVGWRWWRNPVGQQSVRGIWHVHVFFLKAQKPFRSGI